MIRKRAFPIHHRLDFIMKGKVEKRIYIYIQINFYDERTIIDSSEIA